jgi:hypothetical protein
MRALVGPTPQTASHRLDERHIRLDPRHVEQLGGREPPQGGMLDGDRGALHDVPLPQAQRVAGGGTHAVRPERSAQHDDDAELLGALANARRPLALAVVDLAAGELPLSREVRRIRALRRQDAVAVEERDRDDDRQLTPRR